jgi:hypothetical protein
VECYCSNSPERTILGDIQRGTGIPDEAFLTKCCWTTICGVRQKYGYRVSVRSDTWRDLCARMTAVRSRNPKWLTRRLPPNPLLATLEALRIKRKPDAETKGD